MIARSGIARSGIARSWDTRGVTIAVVLTAAWLVVGCTPEGGAQGNAFRNTTAVIAADTLRSNRKLIDSDLPYGWVADPQSAGQIIYQQGKLLIEGGLKNHGIILLQHASEKGDLSAHFALAKLAEQNLTDLDTKTGMDVPASRDKAINDMLYHLRLAADQGHSKSQAMLAILYENGKVVGKNPTLSAQYYQAAALGGVVLAQYNIGKMFADPDSAYYSPKSAAYWWQKAADAGDSRAQSQLGWMYYLGTGGLRQSSNQAYALWQQAYAQGDATAALGLGDYSIALSPPDYAASADYYRIALDAGQNAAALPLARQYHYGWGVAVSLTTAADLYAIALSEGETEAMRVLGEWYSTGTIVPQDQVRAIKLLSQAYENNDHRVLRPLVELRLENGEMPLTLLSDYLQLFDLGNPDDVDWLHQLRNRYALDWRQYVTVDEANTIREIYARKGDITLQRQLAAEAAKTGDIAMQEQWLAMAAAQGDMQARLDRALLFQRMGDARGITLLRDMSAQAHPSAQFHLAQAYIEGIGVPANSTLAWSLLMLVLDQDIDTAYHPQAAWAAAQLAQAQPSLLNSATPPLPQLWQIASQGGIAQATMNLAFAADQQQQQQQLWRLALEQGHPLAGMYYAESLYTDIDRNLEQLVNLYQDTIAVNDTINDSRHFFAVEQARLRLAEIRLLAQPQAITTGEAQVILNTLEDLNSAKTKPGIRLQAIKLLIRLYIYGLPSQHDESQLINANLRRARQLVDKLSALDQQQGIQAQATLALAQGDVARARTLYQPLRRQAGWAAALTVQDAKLRVGDMLGKADLVAFASLGVGAVYPLLLQKNSATETAVLRQQLWQHRQSAIVAESLWALHDLAEDYRYGYTLAQDIPKAFLWYHLAQQMGSTEADLALAQMYLEHPGLIGDKASVQTIRHLQRALRFGKNTALVALAQLWEAQDTPEAKARARQFWQQAHAAGIAEGTFRLALAQEIGIGGEANPAQAAKLFSQLYAAGNHLAGVNLARLLIEGKGIKQDFERGLEILQKAADQGEPQAWMVLGQLYGDKQNAIYDANKAAGFLLLSAQELPVQRPKIWFLLGQLYDPEHANSGLNDAVVSYDYYLRAAQSGWIDAMYKAGLGYRLGYGNLKQDLLRAYAWLELAAEHGDVAASLLRDSILIDLDSPDGDIIRHLLTEFRVRINRNKTT